ncbi:hypothetical protein [Salinispora pacifica]|uniref:hypothetical protein n=1 Tax=Salinispora pacifica TaxID=351187 RepID=UPI000482D207|nr:hypothetical protein [Salinispora pacifica]
MAELFYANTAELATLTNTFAVSGTPTDPTTISLVITDPTGTATTYTYAAAQITRSGTGVYTKDIPCSAAGVWTYVWIGTGAASDVTAGTWTVQSTSLNRLYCTPEELKSRVGIADSISDLEILGAVITVSRWIEDHCERTFHQTAVTRTFDSCDAYLLAVDDLVSVTSVATDTSRDGTFATTWTATDYQLLPLNPAAGSETRPYTSLRSVGNHTFPLRSGTDREGLTQIVGVFGWAVVPAAVRQAAAIWATDLLKLSGMAFGIAGYGEYGPVRARPNPIVDALLAPYRRHPVKVA